MMNLTSYQPPVDKLLTLGLNLANQQHDYIAELGLGSQHIPDLIRMGVDNALLNAEPSSLEAWAAVHAWRALGQLRAEDAIAPLMQLFHELEDSDAVSEELPKVFSDIGAVVISQLAAYLADDSHKLLSRVNAINSLEEIAKHDENARNHCIVVLTQQLQKYQQNSPELNGFIIAALINLQGKISAPVVKLVFESQQVAEDIVGGTWADVQEYLGISSEDELKESQIAAFLEFAEITEVATPVVEITAPSSKFEIAAESDLEVVGDEEDEEEKNAIDELSLQVENLEINQEEVSNISDIIANEVTDEIDMVEESPINEQEVTELNAGTSQSEITPENIVDNALNKEEETVEEKTSDVDMLPEATITVEETDINIVENVDNIASDSVELSNNLSKQDEIDKSLTEIREDRQSVEPKLIESIVPEQNRGFGKLGSLKEKEKEKEKDKFKQKKKKRNFIDL
ncbi:hypothetical protein [Calothrix sp. UHCC 0171]|uniref:hypothetical protein n=1 Tax=Calothrix sp. UHCC 0171 TaxID=3110245 RepID=UPI002B2126A5|nr:hypothetical protein [Calothrix sp. UHCC 0171]MEA5571846.1 hypothetical protein [Calothrix sp. UHCC 0171]